MIKYVDVFDVYIIGYVYAHLRLWPFFALLLRPRFSTRRLRNHANHVPSTPSAVHVF